MTQELERKVNAKEVSDNEVKSVLHVAINDESVSGLLEVLISKAYLPPFPPQQ